MLINPLTAWRSPAKRVKTPTLLQMEAVECGAAALGIVLGYYGRYVALAELRQACGVSRDGVTAANILKAARHYGMVAKGFKKNLDSLRSLSCPLIVFWHFNHFLVVEGFSATRVYLNDPAAGPRTVTHAEFDEGYTGVVLVLEPGETFTRGGQRPSTVLALAQRLRHSIGALLFCVLVGFLLVIPNLALPAFSRVFIDNILVGHQLDWLPYFLSGMVIIVVLQGLLTLLQLRYLRALKIKLAIGMASRFVWHVLRLPVSFYAQRFPGEISSRIGLNDDVANILSGRLTTTVISSVMVVFYALVMWQYDAILTAIVVFFAVVNIAIFQWVSRWRVDASLRLAQDYGKASGVAIAGLQSMETLKASGLESDFFARWAGYYTKATNAQQDLRGINQWVGILPSLLSALTTLSLLTIGGWQIINGQLSIGMLVAFQLLAQSFLQPVNSLVRFGNTLQELQGNLQRLDDVLSNAIDPYNDPQTDLQDPLNHQSIHSQSATPAKTVPVRLQGYIELRDVTYGYSPLEAPLIDQFHLTLQPGQRIALVGGSGSGKSTIAKLVAGLYEPWSGDIYFDGIPRRQWPRSVLTHSIAVVEQDILLFAGSIRDNLTLWDTTVPDDVLYRACEDAAIHEIIQSIPGGYQASLLEGATNLSGGQRQRLEIARSLVNQPAILILDEATSALDSETEKLIDQKLRQRGCTCLIVAHRLSTIRDCDEIIVLDRGQVIQRGTHEELWQQGGYYAQLIQSEG